MQFLVMDDSKKFVFEYVAQVKKEELLTDVLSRQRTTFASMGTSWCLLPSAPC